jgi:anti-sigma factor RsiW
MTRTQIDDNLLVAYADGELDPATNREVELLALREPAVQARIAMFRRSTELIKEALSGPEDLTVPQQVVETIRRGSRPSPVPTLRRWSLPIAAALAGIAIGVAGMSTFALRTPPPDPLTYLMTEVADYHGVFAAEEEHLVEVPASRKEHLERWLGERVKLAFKVPDLSNRQLTFAGARMFAVAREPVAQLMYLGPNGERVALCIGRNHGDRSTAGIARLREGDVKILGQARGSHVYVVAGPADNPTLDAIAAELPDLLSRT